MSAFTAERVRLKHFALLALAALVLLACGEPHPRHGGRRPAAGRPRVVALTLRNNVARVLTRRSTAQRSFLGTPITERAALENDHRHC